jgi:hypothetical protein
MIACGRGVEWAKPPARRLASHASVSLSLVTGSFYTTSNSIPHESAYSLYEISSVPTVLAMIAGPDPMSGIAMGMS